MLKVPFLTVSLRRNDMCIFLSWVRLSFTIQLYCLKLQIDVYYTYKLIICQF